MTSIAAESRSDDAVRANTRRIVAAQTAVGIGDRVVDAKTVLTWLLQALGAPAVFIGLLVPVRESGSMLPQTLFAPWVASFQRRRIVYAIGAAGQAAAIVVMALVAASLTGTAAGAGILLGLALFATARALTSLSSKDVLGRAIPKGRRGRVTGLSTTISGVLAITLGVAIRALAPATGDTVDVRPFVWLLAAASVMWGIAAAGYLMVNEGVGEDVEPPAPPSTEPASWLSRLSLLRTDHDLRRFMVARTLLLVSALSPPFVVSLAGDTSDAGLAGVGPFIAASGLAAMIGGRAWGELADRSSRHVIAIATGMAAGTVAVYLAALQFWPGLADGVTIHLVAYLLLALVHTGSRIGRKTYVVDYAKGDARTDLVAVTNTAMGLLLLAVGLVTGLLAMLSTELALLVLAIIGAIGVPVALRLPEVSARRGS